MRRLLRLYRSSYSGLPRPIWGLAGVILVNRAGQMVMAFMVLYLTSELGHGVRFASLVLALFGAGSILGGLLGGVAVDRIGPKVTQALSLTLTGLGYITLAHLRHPVLICSAVTLVSTAEAALRPANASMISDYCRPLLRPRAFALSRLAGNLGIAIGPAVGGFLATIDYHYLFWADGVTCLLATTLLVGLPAGKHREIDQTDAPVRSPLTDGPYLLVLLFACLFGVAFFQIFSTYPLYLKTECGLTERTFGLLLATNAVIIVVFEMPLVHSLERSTHLKTIALGAFLTCLGLSLTPVDPRVAILTLTVVVWTTGEMMILPLLTAFVANRASDRNRGAYLALYNTAFSVAYTGAPFIGTTLYGIVGPRPFWFSIAGFGIVLTLGFLSVRRLLLREER